MQILDSKGKFLATLWTLTKGIIAISIGQSYKQDQKEIFDLLRAPAPDVFNFLLNKSTSTLAILDADFNNLIKFVSKKYSNLANQNEKFKLIFAYKPAWFEDLVKFTNSDSTTTKSVSDSTLTNSLFMEFENYKEQDSTTTKEPTEETTGEKEIGDTSE